MISFTPLASSSRGNLYLVESGKTRLLLEAGLPLPEIRRRLDFTLSGIAGVCVTHSHADHSKSAAALMVAGIDLWTSVGTAAALGLAGHRLHCIESREQAAIGGLKVTAFATEHDCESPLGFTIDDGEDLLVFATDTAFLRWKFPAMSIMAIEANFSEDLLPVEMGRSQRARLEQSHMSLAAVHALLDAADRSRLREIHLLHLSRGHSDADRFRRETEARFGVPVYVAAE